MNPNGADVRLSLSLAHALWGFESALDLLREADAALLAMRFRYTGRVVVGMRIRHRTPA